MMAAERARVAEARQRGARLAVLLITAALAVSACLDAPAPSVGPTPTPAPDPTPVTTTYELGTTVWYEGLQVHIDRVIAKLNPRGGPVDVLVRLANPGPEESVLNGGIRLRAGGTTFEPTDSRIRSVPAEGQIGVVLTYEVSGMGSVDDGVVAIGDEPQHIATMPLVRPPEPVTFEPIALDLSGTATAGDLRVALDHGEIRWDLPDWSQELISSLQAMTITYDATYNGSFAGGFAFTGENIALRLPNGSVIGARRDGHSQSVVLIGPGKTKKGLFSRFEIPAGMTGRFALLVRNAGAETGVVFTVGG